MKKINLLLLFILVLCFVGCVEYDGTGGGGTTPSEDIVVDIYTLNDLHGAIEKSDGHLGLDYISNFIKKAKEENEYSLLLAAGDMYQGGMISNYYNGRATVEIMNTMNFDAMVIGNHEFDWGIEEILKYHDGNLENGEANFPLLAANIVRKDTKEILPNTKDYVIVEKGDVKIGIIGTIGYGLESSIKEDKVQDYEFLIPQDIISEISYDLRKNQDVDVVVALTHDDGGYTNSALAELDSSKKIDAVINGHYHRVDSGEIYRSNGLIPLPYIQAGSYGQCVGKISLELNKNNQVKKYQIEHVSSDENLLVSDYETKEVINRYLEELGHLMTDPIVLIKNKLYRDRMTYWIADCMMIKFNADFAFQNLGGVKYGAFSDGVDEGDYLNLNKLFEIMPHDNLVKICEIKGADIVDFMISYQDDVFSTNVEFINGEILINGEPLDYNKTYKFATNDYIFDKSDLPFLSQEVQINTAVLIRDLMIEAIENQKNTHGYFDIYSEIFFE